MTEDKPKSDNSLSWKLGVLSLGHLVVGCLVYGALRL